MKRVTLGLVLIYTIFVNGYAQLQKEKTTVRVLTFNILHGATTQNTFDLDTIASVIIAAQPDFVALQEVDFKTQRAHQYDLVTELGWRAKLAPLFGRAMYFDGGEYGEGILSQHSIIASENIALPHQPDDEPRAALSITSTLPSGDTISFIATHLDHTKDNTSRHMQTQKLVEIAQTLKYPAILAGDLNDIPGSEPINLLEQQWTSSYAKDNPMPTYPSENPILKIDYVMVYPSNRWQVIDCKVIANTIASDHCAYLVTLELIEN